MSNASSLKQLYTNRQVAVLSASRVAPKTKSSDFVLVRFMFLILDRKPLLRQVQQLVVAQYKKC